MTHEIHPDSFRNEIIPSIYNRCLDGMIFWLYFDIDMVGNEYNSLYLKSVITLYFNTFLYGKLNFVI